MSYRDCNSDQTGEGEWHLGDGVFVTGERSEQGRGSGIEAMVLASQVNKNRKHSNVLMLE